MFKLLYDTREKQTKHILTKLDVLSLNYKKKTFKSGDYSFSMNNIDYSDQFIIERKASWSELYGNVILNHKRFKSEFQRLLEVRHVILLIEDERGLDGIDLMRLHSFKQSKLRFKRIFKQFIINRNSERRKKGFSEIQIVYCNKKDTAQEMLRLIKEFWMSQ